MTATIVATRPEPGLSATIAAGRALGLVIAAAPLSRVEGVPWAVPDLAGIDALLVGSANAFRHGGKQLERVRHLPVFAVGGATAAAAEEAGFEVEKIGEGGLQSLLDPLTDARRLLRLAGKQRIDLTPPDPVEIIECVLYRVVSQGLTDALAKQLKDNAIVLLHSAGSAAHFAAECDRLGIERARVSIAALGPRIADAAGDGWKAICTPDRPNDAELLAMVSDMCL